MAKQLNNGKWNPIIYSNGFVGMTEFVNGEWEFVECDTEEEAKQLEKEYKDFWK